MAATEDLAQGQRLYLKKCAKCHRLYDPMKYNDERWDYWMGKMKKKSKLNDKDYALVVAYLNNMRKSWQ